ncbi:unnamed protein product [Heligmosomoides polygyrus]|uniref:ResIII domain-containing protein n=1 Tax=Heligmosomoides polygyrus TaxID=6339 RepID=A0A183FPQ7_HELPZ|nr:unnamed protein product [Heligmosomoides polygyrus]
MDVVCANRRPATNLDRPNGQQHYTNSVSYNGVVLRLQQDQIVAIKMSDAKHLVMGIQASYGTGKTIIGALIAACAARSTGALVVVIPTTNTAVAQFADTITRLHEYKDTTVVQFNSDMLSWKEPRQRQWIFLPY